MRLAIGRPAGHSGADAGRHVGVEEIDIEADMQDTAPRADLVDDAADQDPYPKLIDLPHVRDADATFAQQLPFELVDRARAEQLEPIGLDAGARLVAEQMVETALAAQK